MISVSKLLLSSHSDASHLEKTLSAGWLIVYSSSFARFFHQQMPSIANQGPKNLTIIGESNSGKTTLLNSFSNYAHYPTLEDAIER